MHYMLLTLLHSHYMQHVMYVITYPLHAFEDANAAAGGVSLPISSAGARSRVWPSSLSLSQAGAGAAAARPRRRPGH